MTIREENVHDRDSDRQGHVSAFPFTPFAIASESLASQLCLPTALTHGRFASSLCLCLCLCLCPCRLVGCRGFGGCTTFICYRDIKKLWHAMVASPCLRRVSASSPSIIDACGYVYLVELWSRDFLHSPW